MRMYTIIAAVILMLVALLLLVSYRPPVATRPGPATTLSTGRPIDSVAPLVPSPASSQPAVVQRKSGPVEIARAAASGIDTLISQAADEWLRASELLPQGDVPRDTEDAAARLQKAAILADSARQQIVLAHGQADIIRQSSYEAGSNVAFRIGVLYTAADRYLKSMRDDAEDRYQYHVKSEASLQAALGGDHDEVEIQQNVANGYLRSSEERQPTIRRLAQQMDEALRNIENASR